jgi:hypothetical protein
MKNSKALRLPVISLGAEHLVIGHLMRRNILVYKAPPNNEGYDIICIHPDPKKKGDKLIRVQVKSRYQTDCNRAFLVKEKSFKAFDYLIVAFLNIGFFFSTKRTEQPCREPEFFVLPVYWIRRHHKKVQSGLDSVHIRGRQVDKFKNERGIELIAKELGVPYPKKVRKRG